MKSYRPTTPSRRHLTTSDYSGLSDAAPFRPLLRRLPANAGRNNSGIITTRHQGGGNKKLYRMVDFLQKKMNVPARVLTIEYDPYRSAFIALIGYRDGEKAYILAPDKLVVGATVITAPSAPFMIGNRMQLKNIPIGQFIHNIEIRPGSGGKLARSAGTYAEVVAHDAGYTDLKMSSKEIRRIPWDCYASLGQVSNIEWNLVVIGKAGRSRGLGVRPTVRGTVMNPVDHPYGGGEGKQPRGTKRPKTIYGKVTGGHKTRNRNKWSNKLILQRRPKVR